MSDRVIKGKVSITNEKGEVLNPGGNVRTEPTPAYLKEKASRQEVADLCAAFAVQIMRNVDEALEAYTTELNHQLIAGVRAEMEKHTLRGRLKRLWWRIRPPMLEVTDTATAALDPNVNGVPNGQ